MIKKKDIGIRVNLPKRTDSQKEMIINADFFNQSLEAITEPKITFELTSEEDKKYFYDFNVKGSSYELNLGKLKAGKYQWIAKSNYGGKQYKKSGVFVVEHIQKERTEFIANHKLLQSIAAESNGSFYNLKNYSSVYKNIENDGGTTITIYEEKSYENWIEIVFFLVLIAVLLAIEWFLRRRFGTY